jgi:hypothetical protein
MKTFLLTTMTVLFVFLLTIGVQAQNAAPKLDQLKLMENLWVGNLEKPEPLTTLRRN